MQFCQDEQAWLSDYAFFRALMRENKNRETWDEWREEHRTIELARDVGQNTLTPQSCRG